MRIKIIVLLLLGSMLFGLETYEPEHVKTYKGQLFAKDLSGFGVDVSMVSSPRPYLFFENDILMVEDHMNNRLVALDMDFNIDKIVPKAENLSGLGGKTSYGNKDFVYAYSKWEMTTLKREGKEIVAVFDYLDYGLDHSNGFIHVEDYYFIIDEELKPRLVIDPQPVYWRNSSTLLSYQETVETVKNGLLEGLEIRNGNRVFYNNEILNRNYKTIFAYWKDINGEIAGRADNEDYTYQYLIDSHFEYYLGQDKNGNHYWNQGWYVIVFTKDGYILDYFLYDAIEYMAIPILSPSGDLYIPKAIKYRPDGEWEDYMELYKIARRW